MNCVSLKKLLRSHTFKMSSMLILVFLYFLVELIVGHMLRSVTLIADSFHMLSDFIALGIGILARRIGKWPKSDRNTFGWQRAEIVGTLTNTVMLTTLTFTIFIKSVQRFIEVEEIKKPKLLFYVGIGGLFVNIIGLIILRGSHGHSHGDENNEIEIEPLVEGDSRVNTTTKKVKKGRSAAEMNLRAVFLHVLADFMGSIAVVASALILWLVEGDYKWKSYIDPTISLLFVFLILVSTVPLLKGSALILLQSVPKQVSIMKLKEEMEKIEGIIRVHDLHVWLLQSDVIIGTVHIRCTKEDYVETSQRVKELFHKQKIHCTTIQAEFNEHDRPFIEENSINENGVTLKGTGQSDECRLFCRPNTVTECAAMKSCCPRKIVASSGDLKKINVTQTSDYNEKEVLNLEPHQFRHQNSMPCMPLLSDQASLPIYAISGMGANGNSDMKGSESLDYLDNVNSPTEKGLIYVTVEPHGTSAAQLKKEQQQVVADVDINDIHVQTALDNENSAPPPVHVPTSSSSSSSTPLKIKIRQMVDKTKLVKK